MFEDSLDLTIWPMQNCLFEDTHDSANTVLQENTDIGHRRMMGVLD